MLCHVHFTTDKNKEVVACIPLGVGGPCTVNSWSSEGRAKPLLWVEKQDRETLRSWPSPSAVCRRLSSGRTVFLHLRTRFPSKLGFRLHRPRKWLLVLVRGLSMLVPAAAHRREGERRGCPKKDGFSFSSCAQRAPRGPGLAVLKSHTWWDLRANNPDFEKCTRVLELRHVYFLCQWKNFKCTQKQRDKYEGPAYTHFQFQQLPRFWHICYIYPFFKLFFFHMSITQIQQLSRFETLFSLVPFLSFFFFFF